MIKKLLSGLLQGVGFAIGFAVVGYFIVAYLIIPKSIGNSEVTADVIGIFAGNNPQKGKGNSEATLSFSEDGKTLFVEAKSELRNTSGKGAWTRIRNAKVAVLPGQHKNEVQIKTSGDWRNGSGHAHWQGKFTLVFQDQSGKEVELFLLEENERTGPKSGSGEEYKPRSWVHTMEIPDDFWTWIRINDVDVRFNISLVRID